MVIDPFGNVGVGTSSPSERLDVNGYVKADGVRMGQLNLQYGNELNNYDSNVYLQYRTGNDVIVGSPGNNANLVAYGRVSANHLQMSQLNMQYGNELNNYDNNVYLQYRSGRGVVLGGASDSWLYVWGTVDLRDNLDMHGNDILNVKEITYVGADPIFRIDDRLYSTWAPEGPAHEVQLSGTARLDKGEAVIEFENTEEGSKEWLFGKIAVNVRAFATPLADCRLYVSKQSSERVVIKSSDCKNAKINWRVIGDRLDNVVEETETDEEVSIATDVELKEVIYRVPVEFETMLVEDNGRNVLKETPMRYEWVSEDDREKIVKELREWKEKIKEGKYTEKELKKGIKWGVDDFEEPEPEESPTEPEPSPTETASEATPGPSPTPEETMTPSPEETYYYDVSPEETATPSPEETYYYEEYPSQSPEATPSPFVEETPPFEDVYLI